MTTQVDAPDRTSVMPVGIDTLSAAGALQFDLYISGDSSGKLTLYRSASHELDDADLDKLRQRGIHTLYISSEAASAYREHLRDHVLTNIGLPPAQRYGMLREATRAVLTEAFHHGNMDRAVEASAQVGQAVVDVVCGSQAMLGELLQVMSYDYDTFTHAMNVATYSLLLAQRFGITDQQELLAIGQGALLHDIGKRYVPLAILEKPGRLNDREKRVIMQHPLRGFKDLCRRADLTWGSLMMVYQHHERCDGRGYPAAVLRSEIHEYGRLCAIADVTDALMRDRPYRKATMQSDVVVYLDRQAGRGFDEEMTRCWIATIQEQT